MGGAYEPDAEIQGAGIVWVAFYLSARMTDRRSQFLTKVAEKAFLAFYFCLLFRLNGAIDEKRGIPCRFAP
tara:strand:- start:189 stop:401 length:213 start_codon:yes stop_codon:yes gene_type:complete